MTVPTRLDAVIRGRVQGVGYRYFVLDRAHDLGLEGWVANESDGSVRCRAEGARATLERLLTMLQEGPPGARVDRIETIWGVGTGTLGSFSVRSGGHRGD